MIIQYMQWVSFTGKEYSTLFPEKGSNAFHNWYCIFNIDNNNKKVLLT